MFREIPEYSVLSRFMATVHCYIVHGAYRHGGLTVQIEIYIISTTSYMPCQQFLHGTHGDELLLLVHPFNGLLSRTTWLSRHQKGKPFWILLEQELMWWQWHQLDHMQSSLQTDNHASTSPLSFLQARSLPAAQPTASKQ